MYCVARFNYVIEIENIYNNVALYRNKNGAKNRQRLTKRQVDTTFRSR